MKQIENNKVKKIKIDGSKLFMSIMTALAFATVTSPTIVFTGLVEAKWMMLMMYGVSIILTPIIYKVVDYIDFY